MEEQKSGGMNVKAVTSAKAKVAATPRAVVLTILGTLFLVLAANVAAGIILRAHPINDMYLLFRDKWRMLDRLDKPVDWLIVGDSAANNGGMPAILEKSLKGRAMNFAVPGALGFPYGAWILQTYIKRWGPPKGVIFLSGLCLWEETSGAPRAAAYIPMGFREMQRLTPKPFATARDFAQTAATRYLSLYAENTSLSQTLRTPWRERIRHGVAQPDGFGALHPRENDGLPQENLDEFQSLMETVTEPIGPNFWAGLETTADIAQSAGISVYVTHVPLSEVMKENPRFREIYANYVRELSRFAASRPHVKFIPVDMVFPNSEFRSIDHMLLPAATEFNERLGPLIKQAAER